MYCVLQTELVEPTREQLVAAFESIERLTRIDAERRAQHAAGVVATDLSAEDAASLCGGLAGQGIEAEVVAHRDLPTLPQAYRSRRVRATQGALIAYDTLDRPIEIAWPSIRLFALGGVSDSGRGPAIEVKVSGDLRAGVPLTVDWGSEERRVFEPIAEIHSDSACPRLTVSLDRVRYTRITGEPPARVEARVPRFTEEIAAHATAALVNAGVPAMVDRRELMTYPSPTHFEREMQWLYWLVGRA